MSHSHAHAHTHSRFKARKLPRYAFFALLFIGALLNLGFLSFSGMYVIWPAVAPALASFFLAVSFEGEIYLQNISGAFKKLFKPLHQEQAFAKKLLLSLLQSPAPNEKQPRFFRLYLKQLDALAILHDQHLDEKGLEMQAQIEKRLSKMEKWFAYQLFHRRGLEPKKLREIESDLHAYLDKKPKEIGVDIASELKKFQRYRRYTQLAKAFSATASVFMMLSTSYLLMDCAAVLPWVAHLSMGSLALFIAPLSIVSGLAYGFLTFNSLSDLIHNETIQARMRKIRDTWNKGSIYRSLLLGSLALVTVSLALLLTICTAGTWWTVAKKSSALFRWISRLPTYVMGVINPIVTGLAAIIFNVENVGETLELVEEASPITWFKQAIAALYTSLKTVWERENILQIINPGRLVIAFVLTPLRMVLFIGHLMGIALTTDQVPFWSASAAAVLGFISEGFEDLHYFFGQEHALPIESGARRKAMLEERLQAGSGHSHHDDIPSMVLKAFFLPTYVVAALWDAGFSRFNRKPELQLGLRQAFYKQYGVHAETVKFSPDPKLADSTDEWCAEEFLFSSSRYIEKNLQPSILLPKRDKGLRTELEDYQKSLQQNLAVRSVQAQKGVSRAGVFGIKTGLSPEARTIIDNIHLKGQRSTARALNF